ncbi:hypothetical protein PPERSA_10815 [Pseudocohnilembus persalinus]|uniref:Uncharacterized protein n=1 Tax=Pseudocohnilembus persalinus TaxID=266149 RepID=A0A0V0QDQ7_PSEPJ|nr:hypothetical protein PPERSA_10815 [Pseudocohnilembus persalinus]|eukprot:KRX00316.1 hypothetical protein PPERSA_10815 [Pseudocohnilembus persalinus]
MFKKRQKKEKVQLDQEDLENEQKQQQQDEGNDEKIQGKQDVQKNNQQGQDIIKKGRKKQFLSGIDPKKLIELTQEDQNQQKVKGGGDVVDQIEARYYKENKHENQDKLMENYVKQKLQEKLKNQQKDGENYQEKEIAENESKNKSLAEQIKEMKKQIDEQENQTSTEKQLDILEPKEDNFISQAISTTWTNGIMEVKTSLEQKAENMAKMAEFQRKQLLKGIIQEETYQQKIQREKQEFERKKNIEKMSRSRRDKEMELFMKNFYKEGRAYKSKQKQNSEYNSNIENL